MSIKPFEIRVGEAGCRRNQLIDPRPGMVRGDVEDDFHHFWVEIDHDGERVTAMRTGAERWPWTTCPAAGSYLAERMTGARLDELAQVDSPFSHCTHQHDLALLAAAHAHDTQPTLLSTFYSDPKEPARTAELYRNGERELLWEIRDSEILSPGIGEGLSLRKLKEWEVTLTPSQRESARVLRRTIYISGGRFFDYGTKTTADQSPAMAGACYSFQPIRSASASITMNKRDFSGGGVPLAKRIEEAARQIA